MPGLQRPNNRKPGSLRPNTRGPNNDPAPAISLPFQLDALGLLGVVGMRHAIARAIARRGRWQPLRAVGFAHRARTSQHDCRYITAIHPGGNIRFRSIDGAASGAHFCRAAFDNTARGAVRRFDHIERRRGLGGANAVACDVACNPFVFP